MSYRSDGGLHPMTADGATVVPVSPAPTGGAGREAIEHHYDIGREFYRLWLDSRMVYSCALWTGDLDDNLDAAQVSKLEWHATAAAVDGAPRVLDVGCGWGAMLEYLTNERQVGHATGLTLSADQAAAVRPSDRVEVRLEDWRDHHPPSPYDAIISIGAFEHFARYDLPQSERRAVYRSFFERCSEWLNENGRLSLQSIAHEDFDPASGLASSFFVDEIFPESGLPQLSDIVEAAEPVFRVVGFRNDGAHYEHTLQLWQQRLEDHKDEAIGLVGRETYRRYLRYLRVSRAMFGRRMCTLYRVVLERRGSGGPGSRRSS